MQNVPWPRAHEEPPLNGIRHQMPLLGTTTQGTVCWLHRPLKMKWTVLGKPLTAFSKVMDRDVEQQIQLSLPLRAAMATLT